MREASWREARHPITAQAVDNSASVGLLTIAALLCCLPYLVFGPLAAPSQVQPWAALVCWLFLAQRLLTQDLRINRLQMILAAFAFWFMVYVYRPDQVSLDYYFRRSASFLLSWGIVMAMQYLSPALLWRLLKITLPLWTAFGILGYVSTSLYFKITAPLVPTIVGVAGGRGTTSLAPEATDFGFTMAFMLLLCMVTRSALRNRGATVERWPLWLAVFNIALSQSGSGFFAAVAIGILYALVSQTGAGRAPVMRYLGVGAFAAVMLIGLSALAVLPETGIRGIDLMATALKSPEALFNTTFSYRVVHNYVGILGIIDSRFAGFGAGAFIAEGPRLYAEYGLGRLFGLTGWYATNVPATLSVSPTAFFPVILLEYGIVGLIYIVVLFRGVGISRIPYKPICIAMMFMTWAQSFPAAYPPFWLLVGLAMNPSFRDARKTAASPPYPLPQNRRLAA
ncbi:MAG: hypothetical protein WA085_20580 [Sphingobium sp.]|uniref:hypothetical protein n=1 Tax=Sphingobium sp. CECT 9361 TaxID=2845384 RepID=UPI001E51FC83|nr:hypothetical protein [Sphingobium sp. CECT 9361]CAH0349665.1 hypothetical protein SPH9361_00720 [Sphingobium sp. CECT 9361]